MPSLIDSFPGVAIQALDRSLKSLQLEYLDLFLLHWPTQSPAHLGDATDPPRPLERRSSHQLKAHVKAAWQTMETLLASGSETSPGRVKAIGVSNFSQPQLEELLSYATVMPAVNQVRESRDGPRPCCVVAMALLCARSVSPMTG